MRPHEIDRYFRLLSTEVDFPVEIILTGGALAVLEGSLRVTRDLDFQIRFQKKSRLHQEQFTAALNKISKVTGIMTQYDESIETWGSIVWPKRPLKPHLYKRFGRVSVYLLDPLLWSIGKMSRYLSSDVEDVRTLFKKLKVSSGAAVRAWGEALGRSPMSSAQPLFKQQVIHFLRAHGPFIWGKTLDVEKQTALFLDSARRAQRQKPRRS